MQVLFCHDGPLRKDNKGNYYGIAHNDEMFQRYYTIADNIATAIRVNKIEDKDSIKKLSKINTLPFKVYEIPNINSLKGLFERRIAKQSIKKAVKESDYIVARLPSMIGNIAIDYAKKLNKPYITEVVACPWDAFWNHSKTGKIVAPFIYRATKKRVKNSSHVVYVTNHFLQKRYPTEGISVNCSNVALTAFEDVVLKDRITKIKQKREKRKYILGTTAAVDVRYKGQQYIIEALGELKKHGKINFEYQLVGDGDQSFLKSVAKKYNVEDQIKFLGPMIHSDVFTWLKTIDIYIQPSRQEGLPRALIEAMSSGLPAIGAQTAGIPELLEKSCLFSNTSKNIEEVCEILTKFTKDNMIKQAKRNFQEARKYDKDIIDERRKAFFKLFKKTI